MGFDSGGLYLGALCRTTSKHVETAYRWSRRGFVLCACAATLPHQCHHHIYNQSYSVCVCVCVCVWSTPCEKITLDLRTVLYFRMSFAWACLLCGPPVALYCTWCSGSCDAVAEASIAKSKAK